MRRAALLWLDDRIHLRELMALARHKTVPEHRLSSIYYLGGATLFLFALQVASGILLTLYYRPSATEAHASVKHLITNVPFGDLVRSVHAWGADLMIGFLAAHVFSVWLTGAYRKPRELTWVAGTALLGVSVGLGFTGYLLPWNELSYFATRVGSEIAGHVPLIGGWLKRFLRAGDDVSGLTLSRFFGMHIALLPAAATGILLLHLALVQPHGVSVPKRFQKKGGTREIPFIPHALFREALVWLAILAMVVSLATFLPRELGLEADPFKPAPAGIKPEWYFLFMFEALKLLPATILGFEGEALGIALSVVGAIALLLMPFLDRRGHPAFIVAGWIALALFVGFTVYGWMH